MVENRLQVVRTNKLAAFVTGSVENRGQSLKRVFLSANDEEGHENNLERDSCDDPTEVYLPNLSSVDRRGFVPRRRPAPRRRFRCS